MLFLPLPYAVEMKYLPDGHVGIRLDPNRSYTLPGGGNCSVNNLGFRGSRDVQLFKDSSTIRIAVLGGSAAFSYRTRDEKIWTQVLEDSLRSKYGSHVEVINAAIPGFSIFDSKINYLYQIRQLNPDIVLVYHTWNDLKYFHILEKNIYPKKGTLEESPLKDFLKIFQIGRRIKLFFADVVYPRQRENKFYGEDSEQIVITPGGTAHLWEKQNYDDLATMLNADSVAIVFASQAGLLNSANIHEEEIRAKVYIEFVNLTFEETLKQWDAVSEIIKKSAANNTALFADVRSKIPPLLEYFIDHVHLTEKGNKLVADEFFSAMSSDTLISNILTHNHN